MVCNFDASFLQLPQWFTYGKDWLDGEAKCTVEATGCNKMFYIIALKTLKRDLATD